jgi:predicted dehydrogenase
LFKARIIGAGSIGNHLAHSLISHDFSVEITDRDPKALERMQNIIYPERYGSWDNRIKIIPWPISSSYDTDLLVIGTPPEFHLESVLEQLQYCVPKIVLIEKPLSHPNLSLLGDLETIALKKNIRILVGYNHRLTTNTVIASEMISDGKIGEIISITSQTRESCVGILKAHPWLNSINESYLSSSDRGGGALYEHSHALNLLQYFISICNLEKISTLQAALDLVGDENTFYDRISFLTLYNQKGNIFHVIQDFVTNPPVKEIRFNGTLGDLLWRSSAVLDEVICYNSVGDVVQHTKLIKQRKDDFSPEIIHIAKLLSNEISESPLDYKFAVDTMKIINAAFESNKNGRRISIN